MRYLIFNWIDGSQISSDLTELTDEQCEELAKKHDGRVYESSEDFKDGFNSEHFSPNSHQIRIIDDITPELEKINRLITENEIGAWESDLETTKTAIIMEDFKEQHDDLEEGETGIVKYNGWGDKLLNLIKKDK